MRSLPPPQHSVLTAARKLKEDLTKERLSRNVEGKINGQIKRDMVGKTNGQWWTVTKYIYCT